VLLLENKTALIHGAAGAIGSAVARTFAAEGARVFLAGRTLAKVRSLADDITADGGFAHAAQVDALDQHAVEDHAAEVAWDAGRIDIAFNAVGLLHVQGPPLAELSLEDFAYPINAYTRTNFITAKAAAAHMVKRRSGVILTLSTPGSRMAGAGFLGFGVTCAAIEALSRLLAAELGPSGVRTVCVRPHAIPEAVVQNSHSGEVFAGPAERAGTTVERMLADRAHASTLLQRFPTLAEVAHTAAFLASDRAGAMTATVANLTCGSLVD
jgi:NAD(P)-dependent dehydrogenase (short-subunit alcohol dehydrogenase family)